MDILEKRMKLSELTAFEKVLSQFNEFDLKFLGDIKNIEEKSEIVTHKFIFIKVVKDIDLSNIDVSKANELISILNDMKKSEQFLLSNIYKLDIPDENKKTKKQDKVLLDKMRKDLKKLFDDITALSAMLKDIIDLPGVLNKSQHKELSKEEIKTWCNDFDNVKKILKDMKIFCHELEHYSKYWKERIEKTPFIDANEITKTDNYLKDYKNFHSHSDIIKKENMIETYADSTPDLHDYLKGVKVTGNSNINHPLHARIDGNFRIVYLWDSKNKHLKYWRILNHDEMNNLEKVDW